MFAQWTLTRARELESARHISSVLRVPIRCEWPLSRNLKDCGGNCESAKTFVPRNTYMLSGRLVSDALLPTNEL